MSKYTTEVRFICEEAAKLKKSVGLFDVEKVIEEGRKVIFNFSYPIFDENYRQTLETKILKHFYTREICEETVGLWKMRLNEKMNLIMPLYNKYYESELYKFNPLYTVDMKTKTDEKDTTKENEKNNESTKKETERSNNIRDNIVGKNKTKDEINTETNTTDKYSDTPQGSISNLESDTYLTNARIVKDNGKSSNSGTEDTTKNQIKNENTLEKNKDDKEANKEKENEIIKDYTSYVTGYSGISASQLIEQFRKTFINIDQMVIKDLEPLFFGLW